MNDDKEHPKQNLITADGAKTRFSKFLNDEEDRETLISEKLFIFGGGRGRDNHDGTYTYYPETKTGYASPRDYNLLLDNLPPDEIALLKKNFIEGSYATDLPPSKATKAGSAMNAEWKEALDFCHSIQKASDKEYLFIARRNLGKSEVVGVAHLSLGGKSRFQSYSGRASIIRNSCIDVYRGKSEHALRSLLQTVCKFYQAWAKFEIQKDFAEQHGSVRRVSCDYELHIPSSLVHDIDYSGVRDNVGKFVQGEAWFRPPKQMLEKWGIVERKLENWGIAERKLGLNSDMTVFVVSNMTEKK